MAAAALGMILLRSAICTISTLQADKGIKCPFCRQYVDGYRSIRA
jgi:hypothetical protein